jgi:hypothetical protein
MAPMHNREQHVLSLVSSCGARSRTSRVLQRPLVAENSARAPNYALQRTGTHKVHEPGTHKVLSRGRAPSFYGGRVAPARSACSWRPVAELGS